MTRIKMIYLTILISIIIFETQCINIIRDKFDPQPEDNCMMWDSLYEKQKECLMNLAVQKYVYENSSEVVVNRSSQEVITLESEIRSLTNEQSRRKAEYRLKLSNMRMMIESLTTENNDLESKINKIKVDIETITENNTEFQTYLSQVQTQNIKLEAHIQILREDNQKLILQCKNKGNSNTNILIGQGTD